jgi:hypothetical protein
MHSKRDDWNYRLVVRRTDGTVAEGAFFEPHDAKSIGGYCIHSDAVKSVVVVDVHGKVGFYLVKDENGHVIQDKTEIIKSDDIRARFEVNQMLRDADIPLEVDFARVTA